MNTTEPVYPPKAEVAGLLARSGVVLQNDAETVAWLGRRGLTPVGAAGLVRWLPEDVAEDDLPRWARGWRPGGYRLLVPVVDSMGVVRSVRARSMRHRAGSTSPKELAPGGFGVKGLVLASPLAVELLAGRARAEDLLVVEGTPDWLTAAQDWPEVPVIGLVAGAWTDEVASRVPAATRVTLFPHADQAGEGFMEKVRVSLAERCRVFVARLADASVPAP